MNRPIGLLTASLVLILSIAGCSSSSHESEDAIQIIQTESTPNTISVDAAQSSSNATTDSNSDIDGNVNDNSGNTSISSENTETLAEGSLESVLPNPSVISEATRSLVSNGYILVRNERLRLDGSIYDVVEFDINYETNTLTYSSSYPNGVDDLMVHKIYVYDQVGNLIMTQDIDEDMEESDAFSLSSREEFIYDVNGLLVQEHKLFLSSGRQVDNIYTYHEDGKLDNKLDINEYRTISVSMEYNENRQLISTTEQYSTAGIFSQSSTLAVVQFEHFAQTDQIMRAEAFDEDGDSISGYATYKYDGNGNLIQIDWFREDGTPWFFDVFYYEPSIEPVFNYFLHNRQFFPEDTRHPVGS